MGILVLTIAGFVLYSIYQNSQLKREPIHIEKDRNDPYRR